MSHNISSLWNYCSDLPCSNHIVLLLVELPPNIYYTRVVYSFRQFSMCMVLYIIYINWFCFGLCFIIMIPTKRVNKWELSFLSFKSASSWQPFTNGTSYLPSNTGDDDRLYVVVPIHKHSNVFMIIVTIKLLQFDIILDRDL